MTMNTPSAVRVCVVQGEKGVTEMEEKKIVCTIDIYSTTYNFLFKLVRGGREFLLDDSELKHTYTLHIILYTCTESTYPQ